MRRALIIANPASRGGAKRQGAAVRELGRAKIDAVAVATEYAGHAAAIAAEHAQSYDAVFTLGGDGTAMDVIGALAGKGPPVGILPGGTGNLLARSLGIPLTIRGAVRALATGREARIDLGQLGDGRIFGIGAGVGVDATMIAETPRWLKRRLGVLSYVIVGLRSLLRFDAFQVSGTVDGVPFQRRASAILVANFGTMFRHLLTLGDGILHDDGVLNVCIFSPTTNADAARITWKMMRRDFSPDPCMSYLSGREIEITTVPPRTVQADGELAGSTPLSVRVLAGAGRLLLPNARGRNQ
ncbi:MAG: diacylglycerol kinase family lipid kinase [Gemmatimonadaceae bacterium]|nr:diacylglycerol kinase family lipid kinase [Gemmatimonadaceae bacterium]